FKLARNGFYKISDEEQIKDINLLRLLYIEARNNVNENVYPLTNADRVKLGQIELLIEKIEKKINENTEFYDVFKRACKTLPYKNTLRRKMKQHTMLRLARSDSLENHQKEELELYRSY